MSWRGRIFSVHAVLLAIGTACGCVQPPLDTLPASRDTPLVLPFPETNKNSQTTRGQQPDAPKPPPAAPAAPSAPPKQKPPPSTPAQTTSLPNLNGGPQATTRVRAWVNGKPIFDDEVWNQLIPQIPIMAQNLAPAQRDAEINKARDKILEILIENELVLQDAYRTLDKLNPKYAEQMKADATKECDKRIRSFMEGNKVSSLEEFKIKLQMQGTSVESIRRHLEREFVSSEFLRLRIGPQVKKEIGHQEIRDYYNQHLNEFQQVERIKWQNVFIATGPARPTMAHAKQFAVQLLQAWAAGEDIAKLLAFDDGDAKHRKGEGVGEVRGDIRPRELEPYLFALKDGEFGPPVEMSTGVHIFRVVMRTNAGVMPFDEKVQTSIRNKLQGEIADRERTRLLRQLRERAIIEIERD